MTKFRHFWSHWLWGGIGYLTIGAQPRNFLVTKDLVHPYRQTLRKKATSLNELQLTLGQSRFTGFDLSAPSYRPNTVQTNLKSKLIDIWEELFMYFKRVSTYIVQRCFLNPNSHSSGFYGVATPLANNRYPSYSHWQYKELF